MVGSWLCGRCRSRIRRLEEPLCRRCGAEVESARNDCGCRARLRSLTRLRSAAAYEGPLEMAIQRFKYQGWRRLAGPLALLMAERLVIEGLAAPWAVAVPLHSSRLRQRGFNQSELLVRELRRRLSLSTPPGHALSLRAAVNGSLTASPGDDDLIAALQVDVRGGAGGQLEDAVGAPHEPDPV